MDKTKEQLKIFDNDIKKAKRELSALLSNVEEARAELETINKEKVQTREAITGFTKVIQDLKQDIKNAERDLEERKEELKKEYEVEEYLYESKIQTKRDALTDKTNKAHDLDEVIEDRENSINAMEKVFDGALGKTFNKYIETKQSKDELNSLINDVAVVEEQRDLTNKQVIEAKTKLKDINYEIEDRIKYLSSLAKEYQYKVSDLDEREAIIKQKEIDIAIKEGRINSQLNK